MIGSSLFLVGKDYKSKNYVEKARPCALCKKMIINAGIENIYIRDTKNEYTKIKVQEFIDNDESLEDIKGY